MNFETALQIVSDAMFVQFGRRLHDVEMLLFKGAWDGQTYEVIAETSGYSPSYLTRIAGPKFWQNLSQALAEKVGKTSFRAALEQRYIRSVSTPSPNEHPFSLSGSSSVSSASKTREPPCIDWGEAPDVTTFYGRQAELDTLQQWVVTVRCRLSAVLGMGGIGKTSLTAKFVETLVDQSDCPFTHIIWRTLRNAPSIQELLADLVPFLSDQRDTDTTRKRLLHWLQQSRCLLIFDNLETILQGGDRTGYFRSGYEDYEELLQLVAETRHQSCVVLTSREKPAVVGVLEGMDNPVRSLRLSGSPEAALSLINTKGLLGTEEEKQGLGDRYNNSPLALKIVATSIQSLFDGKISLFLAEDTLVFNGLQRLLNQQFERLSELEKTIMYWLAINREWTSISELLEDIQPTITRQQVLETLESLSWRSLIETQSGRYTQQPVVMEYMTDQFVEQISTELMTGKLLLFNCYALIKTTVKDYIRDSQTRLILGPISHQLKTAFPENELLKRQLQFLVQEIRHRQTPFFGYSAGNLINLCLYLQMNLKGYDFSNCEIRQANFQGKQILQLNLSHTLFKDCLFTQTFGSILAAAFSPDNKILALGDISGTIQLWQTVESEGVRSTLGQPFLTLNGHLSSITSIAWHSDGYRLISSSDDATLKLWDAQTGSCLCTFQGHHKAIWDVAWSPDGKMIATSSSDQTIKLWHLETGVCLATLEGHQRLVWSVDWSPDGTVLATGSEDCSIRLWEAQSGQCLKILPLAGARVRRVAWSPDGKILASGSSDQFIRLWDGQTGELIRTLSSQSIWINSLAWSPDGKTLASGGNRIVKLWNPITGQCLRTLQGHQEHIWGLHWTTDSKVLVTGSHDQTVRFWSAETGHCRHIMQGHIVSIRSVVWSPEGDKLASCSTDRTIRIWDVETGCCNVTLTGHQGWVFSVSWHPQKPWIASSSTDTTIKLWDVNTGQCLRTLEGHVSWVWSVAWNPDGQTLASSSSTNDLTVRVWDAATGDCLRVLSGHQSWIWWVVWHPSGKILATAGDDQQIKLWDVQTGECCQTFLGHKGRIWDVAWSPSGDSFASSSFDATVRLWDAGQGKCLNVLRSDRPYEGMNITGVKGLTEAQKATLKTLGAIE